MASRASRQTSRGVRHARLTSASLTRVRASDFQNLQLFKSLRMLKIDAWLLETPSAVRSPAANCAPVGCGPKRSERSLRKLDLQETKTRLAHVEFAGAPCALEAVRVLTTRMGHLRHLELGRRSVRSASSSTYERLTRMRASYHCLSGAIEFLVSCTGQGPGFPQVPPVPRRGPPPPGVGPPPVGCTADVVRCTCSGPHPGRPGTAGVTAPTSVVTAGEHGQARVPVPGASVAGPAAVRLRQAPLDDAAPSAGLWLGHETRVTRHSWPAPLPAPPRAPRHQGIPEAPRARARESRDFLLFHWKAHPPDVSDPRVRERPSRRASHGALFMAPAATAEPRPTSSPASPGLRRAVVDDTARSSPANWFTGLGTTDIAPLHPNRPSSMTSLSALTRLKRLSLSGTEVRLARPASQVAPSAASRPLRAASSARRKVRARARPPVSIRSPPSPTPRPAGPVG